MPVTELAEFIDTLVAEHGVRVVESREHLILNDVPAVQVEECAKKLVAPLTLDQVTDTEGQDHDLDNLDVEFGPYRLRIGKNEPDQAVFLVVSNAAFERLLRQEFDEDTVKVARLETPIRTMGTQFLPWDTEPEASVREHVANPHLFLTDLRPESRVPDAMENWILRAPTDWKEPCDATVIWRWAATKRLIPSLAVQVSHDGHTLGFGTSPRAPLNGLSLQTPNPPEAEPIAFLSLQQAVSWVFEEPKQTGMRHGLFNAEVARIARFNQDVLELFANNCSIILETSQIAYRLGLSELSGTALQMLSQLRSEVSDQIGKSTDSTRQLVLALAGALSLGIGLVAAKLSAAAPDNVIVTVFLIATVYVFLVGYVGFQYVNSLRSSRNNWREHLYHFLPEATYTQMVITPIGNAFRDYVGGCVISVLSLAALWSALGVTQPIEEEGDARPPIPTESVLSQPGGGEPERTDERSPPSAEPQSEQESVPADEIQIDENNQAGNNELD